jgi:hypothetical protein
MYERLPEIVPEIIIDFNLTAFRNVSMLGNKDLKRGLKGTSRFIVTYYS